LGYVFGDWLETRENGERIAFLAAFSTALLITGLIELVRWLRQRRAKRLIALDTETASQSSHSARQL